jgi:TrmH family RNA methyltransferase
MRNTGLSELVLVQPGDYRTVECWRTAWGAHDLLESATTAESVAEATRGAHYVAAFSGRRDGPSPTLDVREAATEIGALGVDETAALVFGPESTGLTLAEIASCGRRVLIPTHPDQPSLNLSHAVLTAGYEILRTRPRTAPAPRRATHDEKQAMLALLREGLLAVGALPKKNTDGFFQEWEAMFTRADLSPKEVGLLEHMARRMKKTGRDV